ncbi:MAG TPA: alpha/beta family hydrolase [Armatimonadota bacterium]|jgi:dienelactone hydrolase
MAIQPHEVTIALEHVSLPGILGVPDGASGLVIFAHGSGSSRLSPRNNYVARVLREGGIGTLLFDLLTPVEDREFERRFDIELLTQRLVQTTRWVGQQPALQQLPLGYFGASTGSAAALNAAAELGVEIQAVVSRGGRPDLAAAALARVQAPTLLIVGGNDDLVIQMNQHAYEKMSAEKHLAIVPGATHLFEEPGALEAVARLATEWFQRYLTAQAGEARRAA